MLHVSLLLALMVAVAPSIAVAHKAPPGWRALRSSDPGVDGVMFSLGMARLSADFNGDGKIDEAQILVRSQTPTDGAVFVFMSLKGMKKAHLLAELKFPTNYGLFDVPKGCYSSTSIASTKRTICLQRTGFVVSENEYGWSTLFWFENGKWKQVQYARGEFVGLDSRPDGAYPR